MKKKISIEGMSCGHCVKHVEEALKEIGADAINVSLENKFAEAEVGSIADEKIKAAIEDAGYDVVSIQAV
ncbi:heavy-metal-associated domain-containing protein [Clostridium pasteurianum]|uniref:Copper chaperone n=1 Tax=Clostridium pasteurianum BC1 TaxID=86416 RepID=R4K853_CLOPA|nr:cation transporter [Clostridium pasteurianum]AGK98733.1 copper chaperone [Clostridium pasteurianum BC1]